MRPVALFWPYNDAQRRRLLRISDEYFSRSASGRAGSEYGCRSLRIRWFDFSSERTRTLFDDDAAAPSVVHQAAST
jgi:hypothetical protein